LPDLVPEGKVGYVVQPDAGSIADGILRFFEKGEEYFIPHLRVEKQKYSWSNLVEKIYALAGSIRM
jgi:glycosyltransferase involved in cell wall biosynthesis